MPDVKKRQKMEADAAAAAPDAGAGAGSSSKPKSLPKGAADLPDTSAIRLPGEETNQVPVYDSCDEIRKKINAHLKTPGLTQAQFCRDIHAQLNQAKSKGIQSKQLADFRSKKGPNAGAKSVVFYSAYVYFEKLRIAQKKPKSSHREKMEEVWGAAGIDREHDHTALVTVMAGEIPYSDQYGQLRVDNRRF
ncbi:Uu.00g117250.m01.CDS01 [Anthostomella pinea]|uniref:Uu.00g117250.m01.CDS01 n=1 Tax=Anthostomella pinea TaxID=933095 RepID=A0AAI8VGW9_9PEZI|nr:Uu.00g117250.m01.CDS01 [Anthostomella pinea]